MRLPPLLPVTLGVAAGVAGALVAVAVARLGAPSQVPFDQVAIAVVTAMYAGVAVLVTVVAPRNRVGHLLALGATAWGVGEGLLALGLHQQGPSAAAWLVSLGTTIRALGWLVLVLAVPFVFPDGSAPWPNARLPGRLVVGAIALFTLAALVAPVPLDRRAAHLTNPTGLPTSLRTVADLMAIVGLIACVAALVLATAGLIQRWRTGDTLRQQQLLWLALAFVPPVVFLPLIATDIAQPWLFALVTLPVPVAVAVAVLQRRLYDVQLTVARTLTYAVLSAAVAVVYVVTIAAVGAVLDERGASWLPWLAAGVVAVSFAPLRDGLQRAITRLVYGQWAEPAEVLGRTARRVADATDVSALLTSLAHELAETLRLRRVEILDESHRLLAANGIAGGTLSAFPLTAYGAPVGELRVAATRKLRPADLRLVNDIADQLGAVLHSAALVETLRGAQHRLVLAREEERRRLRRDLHDGLGPTLASLTLKVDELRNRWRRLDDPDQELLVLRSSIQAAVADVRRIVEGLRPASLDQRGLAGAVEQMALVTTQTEVFVDVGELPSLPAAVEVATFRIVQEALANALRHANASQVEIQLATAGDHLTARVMDNGTGTATPRPDGVGLHSMRERAEELGGRLTVVSEPARGTRVQLELPLTGTDTAAATP